MPAYLLEFYLPRARAGEASAITARLVAAAGELTAEGTSARLVQAICLREDELFQCLVDAPSADAAATLRRRAGLPDEARPEPAEVFPLPRRPVARRTD